MARGICMQQPQTALAKTLRKASSWKRQLVCRAAGQAATRILNDTSKFHQQLAGNIYIWKIPPLTSFCPVCLLADRSTWQMELIEAGWMPEWLLGKSTWACSGERSVPPSTSRCNNNRRLCRGNANKNPAPGCSGQSQAAIGSQGCAQGLVMLCHRSVVTWLWAGCHKTAKIMKQHQTRQWRRKQFFCC